MSEGSSFPSIFRYLTNIYLIHKHMGEKKAWQWTDLSQYFSLEYFFLEHNFEQKDAKVKPTASGADFPGVGSVTIITLRAHSLTPSRIFA